MTADARAELLAQVGPLPRRFLLFRHEDPSGVSGTGVVAFGTAYPGGPVTVSWRSRWPSASIWRCMEDLLAVHGHGSATEAVWLDDGPLPPRAGPSAYADLLP